MSNFIVFTLKSCIILIALSVIQFSCKSPDKKGTGEEVLAQIGDVKITVKDFQDTINSYTPYLRSKYNTPEMKKKKLEEMVRFELLAMEAKKKGYDRDPMVQRSLRQALVREVLQKEVEEKVKLEDISEEETKKYFEEHPEKYNKPAQRRLAHILIKDKKTAQEVLKMALQNEMDAIKFRDLVAKYSEDSSNKLHGGDMGYFSKPEERTADEPEIDEKILRALYSLEKVGEIYKELIETKEGYHIIKFTSTRPEIKRSYDQVKRQIQSIIWKERREQIKAEFIKSLREKAKIQIFEDVLSEIKIPEEGGSSANPSPDETAELSKSEGKITPPPVPLNPMPVSIPSLSKSPPVTKGQH